MTSSDNKLGLISMSTINIDEIVEILKKSVEESIHDIDEITSTNPIIDFNSRVDKDGKLLLVSKVRFDESNGVTISPHQYMERLIAAQMIRTIIAKKLKTE